MSHVEPKPLTTSPSPRGNDPRRSSVASRRTCSSCPSSSFFPNASRSTRDLTCLAAHVHSPVQSDNAQHILELESTLSRSEERSGNGENSRPDRQLPSLDFRPLSFTDCAQSNADRPKSAAKLLLDNHIQCLGLRPEVSEADPGAENGQENEADSSTASRTESTLKASDKQHLHKKARPRTASSAYPSTTTSPEHELLVPKKLFSNKLYPAAVSGSPRLTSTHSLPSMSEAASPERTANRSSTRWQTLASTVQLLSSPLSRPGLEANLSQNLQELSPTAPAYKTKRRSGVNLSPSASSCRFQDLDNIYGWDDDAALQKKWQSDYLARQVSERRKARARLKLKRSSTTQPSFHTAPGNIDVGGQVAAKHPRDNKKPVELPAYDPGAQAPATSGQASACGIAMVHHQQNPFSPAIPHRWSSIIAVAPEVVRPSLDVRRLASIRTARSHQSHASLAEPINSTRLSVQIPRLSGQAACLPAADLAPSLSSLNLDMSVRYPDMVASRRPVLRETRSFFSDDSSAIHNQMGSLQNRFHLHSLRSVLPSTPRATLVSDGVDMTPRSNASKLHPSRQMRGHSGEEEERDLYGIVGMTDFAYRKRKVIERLKDW